VDILGQAYLNMMASACAAVLPNCAVAAGPSLIAAYIAMKLG